MIGCSVLLSSEFGERERLISFSKVSDERTLICLLLSTLSLKLVRRRTNYCLGVA